MVVQAIDQYVCCSPDGIQPVCKQKYDSVGLAFLEINSDGHYVCSTCEQGLVAPDDESSRKEPNAITRIKRARFRREGDRLRKEALVKAIKPIEALIAELKDVDPPDFGSFTDWTQARHERLKAGTGQGAAVCSSLAPTSVTLEIPGRRLVPSSTLACGGLNRGGWCSAGGVWRALGPHGPPGLRHRRASHG